MTNPAPDLLVHRGTRAIQRMVEFAPSTGGLALWIRHLDLDEEDAGELLAANDGATIYYGPHFDRLSLPRQAGLVAHQVLHVALRHPQRYLALKQRLGDVDLELFNLCADAIVNSTLGHLSWLELQPNAVGLDSIVKGILGIEQPLETSLLEWDLERLYRAIDDRRPPDLGRSERERGKRRSEGRRQPWGSGRLAASAHRTGETSPRQDGAFAARIRSIGANTQLDLIPAEEERKPEAEAELSRDWAERLTRGHANDGAHSMLRTLIADLPRTRTPWELTLRTQLARGLAMKPGLSWSRPSRSYLANRGRAGRLGRLPWEPGRTASQAVARLVVLVDCSGSVEDPLMERFAREIESISRRLEASLTVIVGDDRVRLVRSFGPGRSNLRELSFEGGGGTDFSPLLKEAERYRPDMAVFLTDLQGPADYRPAWPVIWAVPRDWAEAEVPFGRKLVLD